VENENIQSWIDLEYMVRVLSWNVLVVL
jgi:hypothetical protein